MVLVVSTAIAVNIPYKEESYPISLLYHPSDGSDHPSDGSDHPSGRSDHPSSRGRDVTEYSYFDYSSMTAMLDNFNTTYPDLVELTTAQDAYSLPPCRDGYDIPILRITNEATLTSQRPEVLFLGGIHGNEAIAVSAAMYLAKFLIDNYGSDDYIKYLVDDREIYIMPCLNPYGLQENSRNDGNGEDMNRDFSYDKDNTPFTTLGARAVHEVMAEHLFISAVNWHSGLEAIGYAWGCEAHDTPTDESPDDAAFHSQGQAMRTYAGDYSGFYPTGRNNDVIYAVQGAFSDYAYAATWDTGNSDPSWPTMGCRALGYTVEISTTKEPATDTLGTDEDIYTPGGAGDGYISKNIRLALYQIDTASPYVRSMDGDEDPRYANAGERMEMEWIVGGCEEVDSTQVVISGQPDVMNNTYLSSENLSGKSCWDGLGSGGNPFTLERFKQEITAPETPGTYYYVIRASADGHLVDQGNPEPSVPPRSLYARMRVESGTIIENGGNQLVCRRDYTSGIYTLIVNSSVELIPPPASAEPGEELELRWYVGIEGALNRTYIGWGDSASPHAPDLIENGTDLGDELYGATITLPDKWGEFFFTAAAINSTGMIFYSDTASVRTWPTVSIMSFPNETARGSEINISWRISGAETVDSTVFHISFSSDLWNDSLQQFGPYSGDDMVYDIQMTIPNSTGIMFIGATAKVDSQPAVFYSSIESIPVYDTFSLSGVWMDYSGGYDQSLNITNVRVFLTESPGDLLGPGELSVHNYTILRSGGEPTAISGALDFSSGTGTWNSTDIDVSNLTEGQYHVKLFFRYRSFNISNPFSENYTFHVDHVSSVASYDFHSSENLSLRFTNVSIITSHPPDSPLTSGGMLASSLEIYHYGGNDPLLYVNDFLNFDPMGLGWFSDHTYLWNAAPGRYSFSITIETIFDTLLLSEDEFTFVIPELEAPRANISGVHYSGEKEQTLMIGSIDVEFPQRFHRFGYEKYVEYGIVELNLTLPDGSYFESFQVNLTGVLGKKNNMTMDLSHFPSGRYVLKGMFIFRMAFPVGVGLEKQSYFSYSEPVDILHHYWFEDEVTVTVHDERGKEKKSPFRHLDISGITYSGTRASVNEKDVMIEAFIISENETFVIFSLAYDRERSNWERNGIDISNLTPGEYHIQFTGKVNWIEFHSGSDLENNTRFSINSSGSSEEPGSSAAVIPVLVILFIIFAVVGFLAAVIKHRYRSGRGEVSEEDHPDDGDGYDENKDGDDGDGYDENKDGDDGDSDYENEDGDDGDGCDENEERNHRDDDRRRVDEDIDWD